MKLEGENRQLKKPLAGEVMDNSTSQEMVKKDF